MGAKVKSTVYTAELMERLVRLRSLYEKAITAENVSPLDYNLIRHAGMLLRYYGFTIEDESVLTNFDMRQVNSELRYLESEKAEYAAVSVDIPLAGDVDWEELELRHDLSRRVEIKVPEGFDGRNSFVFVRLMPYGFAIRATDGAVEPSWMVGYVEPGKDTTAAVELLDFAKGFYDLSLLVGRSRDTVTLSFDLNLIKSYFAGTLQYGEDGKESLQAIEGYILFWRRV